MTTPLRDVWVNGYSDGLHEREFGTAVKTKDWNRYTRGYEAGQRSRLKEQGRKTA